MFHKRFRVRVTFAGSVPAQILDWRGTGVLALLCSLTRSEARRSRLTWRTAGPALSLAPQSLVRHSDAVLKKLRANTSGASNDGDNDDGSRGSKRSNDGDSRDSKHDGGSNGHVCLAPDNGLKADM